uniref:Glycosyltransferase family 92 protein n=1 Tax=Acrobeloides nanus TaxID=290746 RepID=A0A914CRX5_9BILA
MDSDCYVEGYTPGCTWGPYIIEAIIPDEDVGKIGDTAILSYKNRSIKIPQIYKTKPRESGLSVCVAAMYWFTNWPKLIEFIEVWRVLGASKFYFYYQSVTREVYEVFKEYEKLGIVEAIKAEVMPTDNVTGFNPDSLLFRIGDRIFQNDCLMRAKTKFASYVDVDEMLIPQSNQSLLEFLEAEEKAHSFDTGGFGFNHAGLSFESEKMPHLKASKDDFDWRKLDFEWLKTAQYADISKMGKAISMPDRVDLISIHFIARTQWPYKSIDVPHTKGVYYHSRVSWAAQSKTELEKKSNKGALYEPRLRSFFTDDLVKTVRTNYQTIMETVEKSMGRKPYHYHEVFGILDKCMSSWRYNGQCSPYVMCYKNLANITEWVYANPTDYEAVDLIAL